MPRLIDMTGLVCGRLTVLGLSTPDNSGQAQWRCRCDCGTKTTVRGRDLRNGASQSCGCLNRERAAARQTRHGHSRRLGMSAEYRAWKQLKARCTNPQTSFYENYGGRGITVCSAWRDDFTAFLRDMGPKPTPRHSIDRIDTNGNYEPGNCRWATGKEQMRNTRRARVVLRSDGVCFATMTDAAEAVGAEAGNILNACRGKHKVIAGYGWCFANGEAGHG